ncbi:MAG TPA: kelch repeat-containing protein [Myxococcales bacterium LLY-WYZ-16_1]|nr:kelch repeat-containing protein [Myxococcales bacterium LLY-WYZ-16_1]
MRGSYARRLEKSGAPSLAVAAMLAASAACGEEDGRFRVAFRFPQVAPAPGSLRVEAEVRSPSGQQTPAEPAVFAPGVELRFERVPYGQDLTVEVRLVEQDEGGAVRYFGRSAPFDFGPGDDLTVPVAVALTDAPTVLAPGSDGPPHLQILNATGDRIATPALRLRVRTRGAERLVTAQDFLFQQGRQELTLEEIPDSQIDGDGARISTWTYDLNASLDRCRPDAGGDPTQCEGLRQIWVRAEGNGFRSPAVRRSVTLDTRSPEVVRATVAYVPGPDAPSATADRAADGTTVVVTVAFDEPVDPDAELSLSAAPPAGSGGSRLEFVVTTSAAAPLTAVAFEARVDATRHPDGVYRPRVRATDLAGNIQDSAEFAMPPIQVDTTAGALRVRQEAVSFVRAPVAGRADQVLRDPDTGREVYRIPALASRYTLAPSDPWAPQAALPLDTFALDDGSQLRGIRIWADPQRTLLMGSASPAADGWRRTDLRLSNLDTPQVFVSGIDGAGNETPAVPIRSTWFVAASGRAPVGRSPHRVETRTSASVPLAPHEPPTDRSAADAPDGASVVARARYRWTLRRTERPPAGRPALAYDGARHRLVLFLGGSTWERSEEGWKSVATEAEGPGQRRRAAMAHDPARGRTVLYGGTDVLGNRLADTWEWDGRSWNRIVPDGPTPGDRAGHAMTWDAARRRVVLAGGGPLPNDGDLDLWTWDGTEWRESMPSGEVPPDRRDLAMTFDTLRNQVLVYGGDGAGAGPFGDLWAWDGTGWTEQVPAEGLAPSARPGATLVYDEDRDRVVLFGGTSNAVPIPDGRQIWEWDPGDRRWIDVQPAEGVPDPRSGGAGAYDRLRGRTVLQGGQDCFFACFDFDDTFEWNGTAFIDATAVADPPLGRVDFAAAHDPIRGGMLIQGGFREASRGDTVTFDILGDVWLWNGFRWTTVPGGPGPLAGQSMAFDRARDEGVLYGGASSGPTLAGTWLWSGSWRVTPAFEPGFRSGHAMVWDPSRNRVVLAGGDDPATAGSVWEWDGTSWTQISPSTPVLRRKPALAHHRGTSTTLLFGGADLDQNDAATGDTWAWTGTDWTLLDAGGPAGPAPREAAQIASSPRRDRVVLFGGDDPSGSVAANDLWEWDGTTWTEVTPAQGPLGVEGGALTYDPGRDVFVLFGGANRTFDPSDETWELSPPARPAVQFAAALPDAPPRARIEELRVQAWCSGSGQDGSGQPSPGVDLVGWRLPGTFETLDTRSTDPDPLGWSVTGDAVQDFVGPERTVYLQCRPSANSGTGFAEVRFDHAELRVRYSLEP